MLKYVTNKECKNDDFNASIFKKVPSMVLVKMEKSFVNVIKARDNNLAHSETTMHL